MPPSAAITVNGRSVSYGTRGTYGRAYLSAYQKTSLRLSIGHLAIAVTPRQCYGSTGPCLYPSISLGAGLAAESVTGICGTLSGSYYRAAPHAATQRLESLEDAPPPEVQSSDVQDFTSGEDGSSEDEFESPDPFALQKNIRKDIQAEVSAADHCARNRV